MYMEWIRWVLIYFKWAGVDGNYFFEIEWIKAKYRQHFIGLAGGFKQYFVIMNTQIVPEPNQYSFFAHYNIARQPLD